MIKRGEAGNKRKAKTKKTKQKGTEQKNSEFSQVESSRGVVTVVKPSENRRGEE